MTKTKKTKIKKETLTKEDRIFLEGLIKEDKAYKKYIMCAIESCDDAQLIELTKIYIKNWGGISHSK